MKKKALQESALAGRIYNREDNLYKKDMIKDILKMYTDEVHKALISGERVQLTKIGTIIPDIKTHKWYTPAIGDTLNVPYTKMRMTRSDSLREKMNKKLLDNIKKGIYGLDKLPFHPQQLAILKKNGYIPEDFEIPEEEGGECTEE